MTISKITKPFLSMAILAIITGCSSSNHHSHGTHGHHQQGGNEPGFLLQPFAQNLRSLFDTDKATLRASAKVTLNKLVDQLEDASEEGILSANNPLTVVGHTDSRASRKYNQRLSIRRAQSVANYLIENGVPKDFIRVSGKGELQPIASNKTRKGMQLNRRVVINVTGDAINIVAH